jgi:pimeloyl-ACP methyl ester carboxylesterase
MRIAEWLDESIGRHIESATRRINSLRVAASARKIPAPGAFVSVGGVGLHYLAFGQGRPVVYLHGAGRMMAEEVEMSDFGRMLSARYRLIAFDRPGYGYSGRRPDMAGPLAQAYYLREALQRLEIEQPILVGHSWGGALALAYAVRYPDEIAGVVDIAGWSHPVHNLGLKIFSAAMAPMAKILEFGAVPSSVLNRMERGGLQRAFAPNPVPSAFFRIPDEFQLGASQLRANAEDLRVLNRDMARLQPAYGRIAVPVEIVLGMADQVVEPHRHGECLAREILGSRLTRLEGVGHMAQHIAPQAVIDAIDRIATIR